MMLTAATAFNTHYIGGIIRIFLNDGTVISCVDRKIRDRTNSKSKALYYLSQAEMESLAASPITQIRFTIIEAGGVMKPEYNSYMAANTPGFLQDGLGYKTNEEVAALLE